MSWISIHLFTASSRAIFSQYLLYSRERSHLFKLIRQYSCLCPRKHLLLNYIRQTFSVFGECEKNAHPRFVLQQQLTLWLCVMNQLCWRKSSSWVSDLFDCRRAFDSQICPPEARPLCPGQQHRSGQVWTRRISNRRFDFVCLPLSPGASAESPCGLV